MLSLLSRAKKMGKHDMRLKLNEQVMYLSFLSYQLLPHPMDGTVTEYPQILNRQEADGSTNSSEASMS